MSLHHQHATAVPRGNGDSYPKWHALHTRSNFEVRVANQLTASGIENYLPSFEEVHQWKDRKRKIQVPLFPGYLFVRFGSGSPHRVRVLQSSGVVGIVGTPGRDEAVAEQEIESIRTALEARLRCQPHPFLREGDWVRVKRGALKNIEGYLVRHKNQARLVISVSVLGQAVSVELDTADVERTRQVPQTGAQSSLAGPALSGASTYPKVSPSRTGSIPWLSTPSASTFFPR
jgi:transcription termination/antitermination protein NusG